MLFSRPSPHPFRFPSLSQSGGLGKPQEQTGKPRHGAGSSPA